MRGVRVLDTATREVVAQRVLLGHYRDRWAGHEHNYLAATTTDHALVVSPKHLYSLPSSGSNESASVIDLATNETVSTIDFDPGRNTAVRATEDGIFTLVPVSEHGRFGRVNGTLNVYDPRIEASIGTLNVPLEEGERIQSVRTRKGDIYVITTREGQTRIRGYEGVDESISVRASVTESAVTVSVAELSGDPVSNAVVRFDGVESRTGSSGNATFAVSPPEEAGTLSRQLQLDTGAHVHQTNVTITFEQQAESTRSNGGVEKASTATSTPGFNWGSSLVGLIVTSVLLWRDQNEPSN
jgi:hypothetical protein